MKSLQTRATGASCKECRRLKIKCDKQVPCGTCTKRGLQSLCPDGQLSGTKGSRYVLASAEESWHRIQALCVRVQDLEYALEKAHSAARLNFSQQQHHNSDFASSSSAAVAATSSYPLAASERHPLLEPELIKIGQDPRAIVVKSPEGQNMGAMSPSTPPMQPMAVAKALRAPDEVPIAQMGTMKISKPGSYRWLGTTAIPAMVLDIGDIAHDHEYPVPARLHSEISNLPPDLLQDPERHGVICAATQSLDDLKGLAINHLPSPQEALHLIDRYFQFSWQWPTIIDRPTVISTLYHPAYSADPYAMSTYNLSALFSVLAMGSLYDPDIDSSCHDFKARRQLARALFFYNWPSGPTAIDEMESLLLLFRTSWPFLDTSAAANYELLAWGIKLGGKLGLHRDPDPLNLSFEEAERRRRVFWGMWFHDSILSLNFGQPPTLAKGFVNCRPPQDASAESSDGDLHPQLTLILQDMLAHFMESGPSPPYAAVLRLDRKIREIDATRHTPPTQDLLGRDILGNPLDAKPLSSLSTSAPSLTSSSAAPVAMEGGEYKPQPKTLDTRPLWLREISHAFNRGLKCLMLLTLHKTYFSYAILRPEDNAVEGKLALSVSATYEAATGLLECALVVSRHAPWLQVRYSPNWVHYQTACMVLYAFPIYTPGYPKVEEAMATADKAVNELFLAHGRDSAIATASLPSVLKCQSKAKESLAKWRIGRWSHPASQQDAPEGEIPTEALFNEKLVITNSLPPPSAPNPRFLRHHQSGSVSLSLSTSTGGASNSNNGNPANTNAGGTNQAGDHGSRGSTPSDMVATSSSMYGEGSSGSSVFHGHQWMNADIDSPLVVTPDPSSVAAAAAVAAATAGMNPSPSAYVGMNSSYFPQQSSNHGHIEGTAVPAPLNDGYGHAQSHSMDWSNAPPVMKVESPPPQVEMVYGNQYASSSAASISNASLLQVPSPAEEYHQGTLLPPVRRVRGLSRARSFPSDHHITSSNVYPPSAGMHSQLYQPMMLPSVHSVSSITPSTMTPDHQGSFAHQQSYMSPSPIQHPHPHSQHHHVHQQPHSHHSTHSSRPPMHEPYGQWINHSPSSPDNYGTRLHTTSSGHFSPTTDMHAHQQSNYLEPRRTSASIPLHALEQAWSSLNVQQR